MTVWQWLEDKAKGEDNSLHEMKLYPADVRLSLMYIKNVFDEVEMNVVDLRKAACAALDDFLKWDMSPISKFVKRQEQLKVKERLKSSFSIVEKHLLTGIKEGNQTAISNWLKATGNYIGEPEPGDAYKVVRVQDKYPELPLPEIPSDKPITNKTVSTPSA